MDIYDEYAVQTVPTAQEKGIRIALIVIAVLGFVGSLYIWWLIIPGIIATGLAIWYWPRLNYEYEYILSKDELNIDKIIAKQSRKSLASLNLQEMELFTNDPAEVRRFQASGQTKSYSYTGTPGQGQSCWVLIRTKSQPELFEITCNEDMIKDMRRAWPQKCKIQMKKAI